MGKPVSYTTTTMQPATVYGTQLRVDAVDAKGKPTGSTYVDNEEAAAEWFATHQEALSDAGATPEETKGAKGGKGAKGSTEKDV